MKHMANYFLSLDTGQHVYVLYPARLQDLSATVKIPSRTLAARPTGATKAWKVSGSVFEGHPWLPRSEVGFASLALHPCFNTDKNLAWHGRGCIWFLEPFYEGLNSLFMKPQRRMWKWLGIVLLDRLSRAWIVLRWRYWQIVMSENWTIFSPSYPIYTSYMNLSSHYNWTDQRLLRIILRT